MAITTHPSSTPHSLEQVISELRDLGAHRLHVVTDDLSAGRSQAHERLIVVIDVIYDDWYLEGTMRRFVEGIDFVTWEGRTWEFTLQTDKSVPNQTTVTIYDRTEDTGIGDGIHISRLIDAYYDRDATVTR